MIQHEHICPASDISDAQWLWTQESSCYDSQISEVLRHVVYLYYKNIWGGIKNVIEKIIIL